MSRNQTQETYVPTMGLEIHAELKTKSKMFCDCTNDPLEKEPNVNVCPVCMGHPGTLPTPNKAAIEYVMRVGFALHGAVAIDTKFDRKNYFYPDLPKGYQISQYDKPIVESGYIDIEHNGSEKRIAIERIHLEEDTARMQHSDDGKHSLIDFNRSSIPLMELVTKPVMDNPLQARRFAEELQQILRYVRVSDAELENGLMRVELNISMAKKGVSQLGTKVEIKNLNSLSGLEAAAEYEIQRQTDILRKGESVIQETRGWDPDKQRTFSQRVKEEASDYRYFPEPDIPSLRLVKECEFDREVIEQSVPELPQAKRKRFAQEYGHDTATQSIFIANPSLADYYEHLISELLEWSEEKIKNKDDIVQKATNYFIKTIRSLVDDEGVTIEKMNITPENFAEFLMLVQNGEITSTVAHRVLREMAHTGGDPSDIIEKHGLRQQHDDKSITSNARSAIAENPDAVADYKKGKENAVKFLIGTVMAKSKGAANPQKAREILIQLLKEE
ncbi:MAG: Asp-tRNA(Asn)/Glu-tRNA(Gln) amidotransferase subunit GatB [Candidatus Spechtbacteria bacterium SB0662_bin_43]|uniref:Aspartyl/glutamyl-tRNA(Asn/Gln) amidotransferase subunit B n=1 Tax=Candidatus Spechtbacteria bacterium SB0662_bin_43 TaxID=2604897 RepID=A0A845DA60_9BACT|nr:Asp-tRNA(Asn)/Glu-tRNA(Gln) amidotransferase subunit GatB [Candidatus Spechtbacteria bacterium SB0662_bin_43]